MPAPVDSAVHLDRLTRLGRRWWWPSRTATLAAQRGEFSCVWSTTGSRALAEPPVCERFNGTVLLEFY